MSTLSVEELMKPRYKVSEEGYPDMIFYSGQILTLSHIDDLTKQPFWKSPKRNDWYEPFFNRFPSIFKRLEWWEERRLEEMPEYIKFYLPLPAKHSIGKVLQWIPKRDCMWVSLESNPSQNIVLGTEDSPATEEQYLTFINKSK